MSIQRKYIFYGSMGVLFMGGGLILFANEGFSAQKPKEQTQLHEEIAQTQSSVVQETVSPSPSQEPQPLPISIERGTVKHIGGADRPGQIVSHLFDIVSVPSPKGAAFRPDGEELWVTMLLNKKRGVAVFDAKTGQKIKDINLQDGGGVEVIFSQDGKFVYVSQMETAQVFEIDAQTKEITRVLDTRSSWTKVLELSKDGKTLFASNWVGDNVSEFDLETGGLLRTISTVDTPRGLYATRDGKNLYVAGFENGDIQKVDLRTGKGKVIFTSGGAMRHIAGDEDKGVLYISDMGKGVVWKVALADDSVTEFAKTDINTNTIALSPDKKVLFVSCRGKNATEENYYIPGAEWGSVLLFDTESGNMLDAIVGGNQPTALDVSRDGALLSFSDFLDNRIQIYQVPSYEVLQAGNGGRSNVYKAELKK